MIPQLLAGFINDVYGATAVPTQLTAEPGELIGALIHYIGIDVTKPLNSWPAYSQFFNPPN